MNRRLIAKEWSELLNGMADATLTDTQERRLTELLQSDPEFRQEYLRFIQMLTALTWQSPARSFVGTFSPKVPSIQGALVRPRVSRSRPLAVIGLLVVILTGFWWMTGSSVVQERASGTLTEVLGSVEIQRHDGEEFRIHTEDFLRQPWPLYLGDRISTDSDSSARIVLSEGTELSVNPETQLTLARDAGLTLFLEAGHVAARVQPQPADQPFTIRLPQAVVEVLGTEFEVFSNRELARLAVTTGRVRVTRTEDGRRADVAASQFLSVAESGELCVVDVTPLPDEWSQDFQSGLPPDWTGRYVATGLPPQSRGAVMPVPVPSLEGSHQEIGSATVESGLFAWHGDSRLHLSYQVLPPGWFHVYVFARPVDDPDALVTLCCVKPELWHSTTGQWQTVSIPLSEFQVVTHNWDGPALGLIPVRIVIRNRSDSMDVTIDRIWVDRRR